MAGLKSRRAYSPVLLIPEEVRAWKKYADPINQKVMRRAQHYRVPESNAPFKVKKIKVGL